MAASSTETFEVFRAALDRERLGVGIFQPLEGGRDLRVVYANDAFQALKPFRPMPGRLYSEIWPELADFAIPRFLAVAETGEPWVERDLPLEIESESGEFVRRYYTYEISRLQTGAEVLVLDTATETTAEVESRRALEEEYRTAQLLLEAADSLAESLDPAEIVETLARLLLHSVRHTRAWVFVWDDSAREVRLAVSLGREPVPRGAVLHFDSLSPVTKEVIETRTPRVVDYDALPPEERGPAERFGSHTSLQLPLVAKGKLVGIASLDDPGERREFTQREVELAEAIAAQAAVAVENARLLEAQTRAALYGDALNRINDEVSSAVDIDSVMRVVIERVGETVRADIAVIYMPLDGVWEARYTWHAPAWFAHSRLTARDIPYSAQTTKGKRVELFGEASEQRGWEHSVARKLGVTEVIDAPLSLGGDASGDLTLYKLGGPHYTEDDRDFVQKASTSVSLALKNARRYESERRVADTLQEALLQLPDEVPDVEFAHTYHSAAEAARVGGDFYDLFELEHGLLGITVGDIAGKGLSAAVLTSLVKNAVRAQATERDKTPAEVLDVVNTVVLRATPAEVFATVFFGVLDRGDGMLRYSNAGHTTGAVVCRQAGSRPERLHANGPLLGAFEGVGFGEAKTRLGPGETLFLYTDGVTEARPKSGELYGEDRLFALLTRLEGEPPPVLVQRVLDDVVAFAGGELSDDLAILAIERTAEGG